MPRPRLSWAILPLILLGLPAGALAAEPLASSFGFLLAQSATVPRGPGLYLNLLKFVPVVLIYLLWAWTTSWADKDMRGLNNLRFETWNAILFFGGLLGLALVFLIPIYFVGLLILVLAYFGSILAYVNHRNQMVGEYDKVLTPYHLGEVMNGLLAQARIKPLFNKNLDAVDEGVPVVFLAKSRGQEGDPERLARAAESEYYESAKELIYDAVNRRATDIQTEPAPEQTTVRYRIDGLMQDAEPFEREVGDGVVHVFKTLAGMDVAERRKPQEGGFTAKCEGRDVEFRVSTSGSKGGEKLVMRLLGGSGDIKKLDETGLRPKMVQQLRDLIAQPSGIVLLTGPSGSGKSTTFYACLREVDRFLRNIITLEEPVEQQVDNVAQNEIDPRKGESFREMLRSIRRQDPDVLCIGEVHESEAAEELVEAAYMGKMCLATLQAPDAVAGLVRLIDLGADAEKLGSNLLAVLSQRLVRTLCETCKEPYKPKPEFLAKANLPADKVDVFYRPPEQVEEICPDCDGVGYVGRTGIFEFLVVDDEMRLLIGQNPSAQAIRTAARKAGMIHLQEDGLRQVIQGRTSIKELMRVVQ